MFRKIIFILFFITNLYSQGSKETVEFIDFNMDIDSTDTSYKVFKVVFDKGYGNQYFTNGVYSISIYPDSSSSSGTTVGALDSTYAYIKPFAPGTTTPVRNDSIPLTSNFSGAGETFVLDEWKIYDFNLPPTSGYAIYYKYLSETGTINFRFKPIK